MEIPVAPPDGPQSQPLLWLFPAVGRTMKTPFLVALIISITPACFADTTTPTTPTPAAKKKTTTTKAAVKKKTTPHKTTAAAHKTTTPVKPAAATARPAVAKTTVKPAVKPALTAVHTTATKRKAARGWVQTWDEPTFKDSTEGDSVEGEDLEVRRAAVEALGPYNGSIVVVDPNTGRILTMVNQRLALSGGFQPCSTIKVSVALAALHEGIIKQNNLVRLTSRYHMDLTQAIAHSNNFFFATLGIKLGYDKVSSYAHLFGYGEKAGMNIAGEQPGYYPPKPPANGGMGMLTSFGEEISQTPLELAALMSAVANGGTLYWLQYPTSRTEVTNFTPQVKRQLDIKPLIDQIKPGLKGAVEFGTARRAKQEETIMGKTGTCSEGKTHLGWFGSFDDSGARKLVVVVLLTGGRPSIGPMAAGVAGDVYRRLAQDKYVLANGHRPFSPSDLISTQICCNR